MNSQNYSNKEPPNVVRNKAAKEKLQKDMVIYFQKRAEKEEEGRKRNIEYLVNTSRKRRCNNSINGDDDDSINVKAFYRTFVKHYIISFNHFSNINDKNDKVLIEINQFDLTSNQHILGGSNNLNCRENIKICQGAIDRLYFKKLTLQQYENNISQLKNCNVWLISKCLYIYVRNENSTSNVVGMCWRKTSNGYVNDHDNNNNAAAFQLLYINKFSNKELLQIRRRIIELATRCDKLCFYQL